MLQNTQIKEPSDEPIRIQNESNIISIVEEGDSSKKLKFPADIISEAMKGS